MQNDEAIVWDNHNIPTEKYSNSTHLQCEWYAYSICKLDLEKMMYNNAHKTTIID